MSDTAKQVASITFEGDQEVEAVIDGVVETLEVVRNNPKTLVAAGVLGLVAGGVGGYFIARKRLRSYYEDLASQEIAEAKEFYASFNRVTVDGDPVTPQDVMAQLHGTEAAEALRSYSGQSGPNGPFETEADLIAAAAAEQGTPADIAMDEELLARTEAKVKRPHALSEESHSESVTTEVGQGVNVFIDDTFDLAEETKYRTADKPYIITHDEFFEGAKNFDTLQLTYFQTDDTLVMEDDSPLDDAMVEAMVGTDHLVRFGSGSKDKNIVYVRNEKRECDYEIHRSEGSYLEEVLGMPDEEPNTLKHSDQRDRRRAFKHGDE